MGKMWSDEACDQVIALYKEGQSMTQIAIIMGEKAQRRVTRNVVAGLLNRAKNAGRVVLLGPKATEKRVVKVLKEKPESPKFPETEDYYKARASNINLAEFQRLTKISYSEKQDSKRPPLSIGDSPEFKGGVTLARRTGCAFVIGTREGVHYFCDTPTGSTKAMYCPECKTRSISSRSKNSSSYASKIIGRYA
jgi:hypothetical protein